MDVLAANRLAIVLSLHMAPAVNRLRALFTDPLAWQLHMDWERGTAGAVAQLRAAAGAHTGDPGLAQLVGELSLKSERFRRVWGSRRLRRLRTAPHACPHTHHRSHGCHRRRRGRRCR
jgi:hypothetical protein